MKNIADSSHSIRILFLFIILWMSACSARPQASTALPITPSLAPRMTIINRVTQEASKTPRDFPTVTPHIFCEGAPESFLIISERGRVTKTPDGETLNLRDGPGINYRIVRRMGQLETFYVLDGPQCSGGYTWFQIRYDGREGWIAEGNEKQYFAEPYLTG